MNPDQYEQLRAAFFEICEIPVERREAFVLQMCARDPGIGRELRELLVHDANPVDIEGACARIHGNYLAETRRARTEHRNL